MRSYAAGGFPEADRGKFSALCREGTTLCSDGVHPAGLDYLKQAIAALHKHGFRVIMDVVYNHTYDLESPLFKTVPWYYYRQDEMGKTSNGSGCGNDIASERSMCRQRALWFWENFLNK